MVIKDERKEKEIRAKIGVAERLLTVLKMHRRLWMVKMWIDE